MRPDKAKLQLRADIKKELQALQREGLINPRRIVDFARNPKTAMHSHFTWDDGVAAEKWRLEEARTLVRVYVTDYGTTNKTVLARTWVSLTSDQKNGEGYRELVAVMSDADMREQLLQDALRDCETFRKKYELLTELAPLFTEMEKISRKHKR